MLEQGLVKKVISPGIVEISLKKAESCRQCKTCCESGADDVSIEASNAAGAREGDAVEFEISTSGVVAASFVVYLVPVIFLIAGYIGGSFLSRRLYNVASEGMSVFCAFVSLAASVLVVRFYDRRVRRKGNLQARVLRVVARPG